MSRVFYFHNDPHISLGTDAVSYNTFPYKWNNNKDGSFSIVTTTTDTKPTQYITYVDTNFTACFAKVASTWANNMMEYTYAIHWGRTLANLVNNQTGFFYDRCGTYTDDLLNYEDTELIEAIRSKYNLSYHTIQSQQAIIPTDYRQSNIYKPLFDALDYNTKGTQLYAAFAFNANTDVFSYASPYRIYNITNNENINYYVPGRPLLVLVPIGCLYKFPNKTTDVYSQSGYNDYELIDELRGTTNFSKSFLGYFKGPNVYSMTMGRNIQRADTLDGGVEVTGTGTSPIDVSLGRFKYQNAATGQAAAYRYFYSFCIPTLRYLKNFQLPFGYDFSNSYTYTPSATVSNTQLEHVHLTQIADYKLYGSDTKYTNLIGKFGLSQSNWSQLGTNNFIVDTVIAGFCDGFLIQSTTDSDTKLYLGSTIPYIYDGYVDWNTQNRTQINARLGTGISGLIGTALSVFTGSTNSGKELAYDAMHWIKGSPTYAQEIRQAKIANGANILTNAENAYTWYDLHYFFQARTQLKDIVFEASYLSNDMIQEANTYLRKFGFGGKSRYLKANNKISNYSGYVRLTNNNENYNIFYDIFSSYYQQMMGDSFIKQFCTREYNDLINEGVTWLCGGFYY